MSFHNNTIALMTSAALMLLSGPWLPGASAQIPPAPETAVTAADAPTLLTADELETLVARIALYPDDLVALVLSRQPQPATDRAGRKIYRPSKTKPDAKPDPSWDGSIISLLNYPTVLTMMNDDLDWTNNLEKRLSTSKRTCWSLSRSCVTRPWPMGDQVGRAKLSSRRRTTMSLSGPAKKEVTYVPIMIRLF